MPEPLDPQQQHGPWEKYQTAAPPASGPWDQFSSTQSETIQDKEKKYGAGGSTLPAGINKDTLGMSVIHSRMLGLPASVTYQNNDQIIEQLNNRGIKAAKSPNDIANDIKVGLQGTIVGLGYRNKLPDSIPDNFHDEFISGLATMIGDLPFYIGGGIIGGAAGSEVPIVGNAAGAGIGAFAIPEAIRKSLVLGIQKGDIKSFSDLMERTAETAFAGAKGGAIGLATEWAGGGTIPIKGLGPEAQNLTEAAFKRLQQAATLTVLSNAMEGHLPTLSSFAVNTGLLLAMHYTIGGIEKAGELAPKLQSKVQDAYVVSGAQPHNIAAEALRQAQESPTENIIDRINEITRDIIDTANEITRTEAPPEAAKATSEAEPEQEAPQPPPASLHPVIRAEDGTVTPGAEGEHHDDIAELTGDGEREFENRQGEVFTRDQAKAWLRENEPEVYKHWERIAGGPDEEFHTTDYNEAVRQSTGIKNASVDAQREQRGLPPLESDAPTKRADVFAQAKEDVDSGKVNPLQIAESINSFPRGLSDAETDALNYYNAQLSNQHKAAMDTIEQARQDDDPVAEARGKERLQDIEAKQDTIEQAARKGGTQSGRALRARQEMIKEDYSLDRVLQRARVASKTGQIPDSLRDQLESLTSQLETANAKVAEQQDKLAKLEGKRAIDNLKNLSEKGERKAARKAERANLDTEFDDLIKQFDSLVGRMSANPFADPELLGVVGKMALNRVHSGLTRFEDVVDYVHSKLTDIGYEYSKREIGDAISGYGKTAEMSKDAIKVALSEVKRQGRLISALEDAQAAVAPLKSGLQRDAASDRVQELTKQVKQAMRESGIDSRSQRTPEQQWKTALDSVKTRLRNQITDLTKQLQTGEKEAKAAGVPLDKEAQGLKDQADHLRIQIRQQSIEARMALRKILQGVEGKAGVSPETKLKAAMAATEKSINEYTRRINENDLTPAQRKAGAPETPELAALRERRDALQETYRQMQKAAEPKKSPEQTALERYKKTVTNRIADLERRYATGDFTDQPKQQTVLDPEATEMKLKSERLRDRINQKIKEQQLANRTTGEKVINAVTKWRRAALLTSWRVLGKLQSAAMYRMGVTPIEELNGGILSQIPGIDKISERAPAQGGGLNISAEAKALSQFWQKATADDMWQMLKTGKTSLDELYGSKGSHNPPMLLDFIGHLHGFLKVLPKRAQFFRTAEKVTQWAIDNNLDINDPRVQVAITGKAYAEAQRSILMQDNVVNDVYRMGLNYMRSKGATGAAAIGEFLFPIVKVPTNFAIESLAHTPAGLGYQTIQLFKLLMSDDKMGRSAMDNLTMHDMDNVMRGLKKGSIGLALMAVGYGLRNHVTGYYRSGKQKAGEPDLGSIRIGKVTIPAWLAESPALASLQLGATMGHVSDHYNMKGVSGGTIAGLGYGMAGIVKSTPFLDEPARLYNAARTPEGLSVAAGELTGNLMVPLLASQIAVARDPQGYNRKAKTFTDAIKLQIPGLRETVVAGGTGKRRYGKRTQ